MKSSSLHWYCDDAVCPNKRQVVLAKGNVRYVRPSRGMVVWGITVTEQAVTPEGCLVPFWEAKG
jgi:hypothetical protein